MIDNFTILMLKKVFRVANPFQNIGNQSPSPPPQMTPKKFHGIF
jgi:hypothetical protein